MQNEINSTKVQILSIKTSLLIVINIEVRLTDTSFASFGKVLVTSIIIDCILSKK